MGNATWVRSAMKRQGISQYLENSQPGDGGGFVSGLS